MIDHHEALYADLADPVALLGGGRPTRLEQFWPYASTPVASGRGGRRGAITAP